MPRYRVRFSGSDVLRLMRSSAGCTTSTSESEFSVHTTIPVASIALILGVDRFMSEARALTNLIGNGVATVVVAKW